MNFKRLVSIMIVLLVLVAGSWLGINHYFFSSEELNVWHDQEYLYAEGVGDISSHYPGSNKERAESDARTKAVWNAEENLFEAYLERDLPTTGNIFIKGWRVKRICLPLIGCHSTVDVMGGSTDNMEVVEMSEMKGQIKVTIKVPINV